MDRNECEELHPVPWTGALCSAVAIAGARAVLVFLQDDYLGRGLPELAWWSLSKHFLAGIPWALAVALVACWALQRALAGRRRARAAVLVATLVLGFAFATSRVPLMSTYVPVLKSGRGWIGNGAGLVAAVVCLLLLVSPTRLRGWLPAGSATSLLLVLIAGAALWIIPAVTPQEEPAPFSVVFEEVAAEVGIESSERSWSIAWGDFDGDGWPEPWLSNHGAPRLYANRAGHFERLSAEHISMQVGDHHGAAWADFDGDGDQDLLELAGAERGMGRGANHLYVYGDDAFDERARELGLDHPEGRGRTPLWVDWDNDGALDVLLLCASRTGAASALYLQRAGLFVAAGAEAGFAPPGHAMFGQLAALGGRASRHLIVHANQGSPQQVLDLRRAPPEDVSAELGIPVTYRSEDVAIADLDGDLMADLFVARRRVQSELRRLDERTLGARLLPDEAGHGFSFRSEGALTVTLSPIHEQWWSIASVFIGATGTHPREMPFRVEPRQAAGDWRTVAGEGKALHVLWDPETEFWSVLVRGPHEEAHLRVASEHAITDVDRIGFVPSKPVRNALYLWREHGFEDFTDRALVLHHRLFEDLPRHQLLGFGTECASVAAGDLDNDMDVDLYAVCSTEVANLENILFENLGGGRFRALSGAAGAPGSMLGLGDAVALADYDRDGFLDLLVSNGRGMGPSTGPTELYRNGGNDNHWLEIDLQGTSSNREALGAQVYLSAGGRTQVRFQGGGMHRGAQDFKRLHFGLGPNERVDELLVLWPSGAETRQHDLAVDKIVRIVE